jgi:ArsR family transcriptional regulator, lead/cadmium/zinc/bismuth-responsive transcriptional repressor
VASRSHEHPVNFEGVAAARDGVLSVADAGRLAGLLGMLADPVRSRILFALVTAGELCVGDLALALDVTEDQVSYGLKMLRLAGLVSFRRDGRMVCYRLSDGFPHPLLEHCLRQLLTIAAPPQAGADPHADPAPAGVPAPHAGADRHPDLASEAVPTREAGPTPEADPTAEASRART